jgi:radical SAM superfamily enzyme YgiQ (UPF0313 family)
MNILTLNPPFKPKFSRSQRSPAVIKSGTLYYPLWLAYATGVLEGQGHTVKLVDAPAAGLDMAAVEVLARELAPGLIVLDTSTPSIFSDIQVAEHLKELLPAAFICLVGTHVSATARETLAISAAVDAIARHEYDYTLRDLAALLSEAPRPGPEALSHIAGLTYRGSQGIEETPDRPFIEDLDELPFASEVYARHLDVNRYFYSITQHPEVTIVTGRGCPHRCTYCVYPQTMFGRRFRHRSPENVLKEFLFIKERFPEVKEIFLEDDTLSVNRAYCQKLCRLLAAEGPGLPWTANSRADVDLETLQVMKAAGCRLLCIGVESGDQTILDNIHKALRLEQVEAFVENARRAGILVHGCFMVGNKGETHETMRRTLAFAKKLRPDTAQFFPIMVYPGTEAYEWARENGYLTTNNFEEWLTEEGLHNCVISTPALSNHELVAFCDFARRSFYLRPGYVLAKVGQVIAHPKEAKRILKASRTFFRYLIAGSGKGKGCGCPKE